MLNPNNNQHKSQQGSGGNQNPQQRPNIPPPPQQNNNPQFPKPQNNNPQQGGGGGGNQQNKNPQQSNKELEVKSSFEIFWDNLVHFFKEAFMKTPYETIFELALLTAGGTRTLQLFNTMGQSGFFAVVGLVYSEIGIILYEFLLYKGKRVKVRKQDKRTGKDYEVYPFVNQKSLAKWGLWLVHIPLTVFFTTSDLILENLKAMQGAGDITSNFAWILGVVIGLAFLADLAIIINYKEKNPARIHEERMFELRNEQEEFEFQKQEIKLRAQIDYEKKNAKPLIELDAKFGKREEIMDRYSPKFGSDYVNNALDEVGLNFGNRNSTPPQQNNNRPNPPSSLPPVSQTPKELPNKKEEESDEELLKNLEKRIEGTTVNKENKDGGATNFIQPHQQN